MSDDESGRGKKPNFSPVREDGKLKTLWDLERGNMIPRCMRLIQETSDGSRLDLENERVVFDNPDLASKAFANLMCDELLSTIVPTMLELRGDCICFRAKPGGLPSGFIPRRPG